VGTPYSRRNLNPLSWNKEIRNIPLDVDLIRLIILKLGPNCFSGEMKNSQGTKMIYHVIISRVSRKRCSELNNSVLTLVRLRNDFIDG
jgi:hypothetical protein